MTLISMVTSDDIVEVIYENIKTNKLSTRKGIHVQVVWWNGIIKAERKTMCEILKG